MTNEDDRCRARQHSSHIVNPSVGAWHTMTLKTKKDVTANTTGNEQGGDGGDDGAATTVRRTQPFRRVSPFARPGDAIAARTAPLR
jgi:hypothetical protein